ncbi:MAG: hypothetical protein HKN13_02675 [Rhodothermales bacterium]|nr:hypothetical protein [Rhodothermales bacterium]
MKIKPVDSKADLNRFISFHYDHYRGDRCWIPQLRLDVKHTLDPSKNPFFDHGKLQAFLAEDDNGRILGRIAAIVNGMHLKKYDDNVGFFGFFESVEDHSVTDALVQTAGEWLRAEGLTAMRGPANPSLNDVAGLVVSGFDRRPAIMMPYNKPYYDDYLTRSGFERAMTMWAFYVHEKYAAFDKLWRGRDIVLKRQPGLTIRTIDMSRFDEEAAAILDIYNEAWSKNWGHVPMTDREFAKVAKDMKQVLDPDLILIVEDEGQPMGFAISLPDINQALRHVKDGRLFPTGLLRLLAHTKMGTISSIRMLLMGVRLKYQGRGIDSLLIANSIENGQKRGYESAEMSWVLDSNQRLINNLEAIGGIRDKEYALYEKQI